MCSSIIRHLFNSASGFVVTKPSVQISQGHWDTTGIEPHRQVWRGWHAWVHMRRPRRQIHQHCFRKLQCWGHGRLHGGPGSVQLRPLPRGEEQSALSTQQIETTGAMTVAGHGHANRFPACALPLQFALPDGWVTARQAHRLLRATLWHFRQSRFAAAAGAHRWY